MKGVSPLVGAVLIIAITISAMILAFNMGNQAIDKSEEILLMQEGKNILLDVKNSVKAAITEGNMSTRVIEFRIMEGSLDIDEDSDSIVFSMNSPSQIVGSGVTKMEDGINITGYVGIIYLNLSYDNVDVLGDISIGRGARKLTIRNEGYNILLDKQTISIS